MHEIEIHCIDWVIHLEALVETSDEYHRILQAFASDYSCKGDVVLVKKSKMMLALMDHLDVPACVSAHKVLSTHPCSWVQV
jgi:hypothetical protein